MTARQWFGIGVLTLLGIGLWRGAQAPEPTQPKGENPAPIERPEHDIPVVEGVAIINGEINYAQFNGFVAMMAQHSEIKRLRISSHGGLVPAARAIARQVQLHQIEVEAAGLCASACILVFMAGEKRVLAQGAELGFHRWHDGGMAHLFGQIDPEKRDAEWLRGRGVDPQFVTQIFTTPHDNLWRPTRAELLAAGVLTQ